VIVLLGRLTGPLPFVGSDGSVGTFDDQVELQRLLG
jgi:hypothetical protein